MKTLVSRLLVTSIILLAGCGASDVTSGLRPIEAHSLDKHAVSFELFAASLIDGGQVAVVECTSKEQDGNLIVELEAQGMNELKALYGRLHFDSDNWQDGKLTPSEGWNDDALSLAASSSPGTLDVGIVLAHWEQRAGLSGDGVLGEVVLRPEPIHVITAQRAGVATQPDPAGMPLSASEERSYFSTTGAGWNGTSIRWYQDVPGDYDQNGEVNISDLTPLARHLGATATGSDWPMHSIEEVLDGDSNLEINLADLSAIGANFGLKVDAWELTFGHEADVSEVVLGVPYQAHAGNPSTERLKFEVDTAQLAPYPFFFLEAVSQGTHVGGWALISESSPHPSREYAPNNELAWNTDTAELDYLWRLPGDGNQDGECNIADLTALAVNFGLAGPFTPGSGAWHVDYDGNGQIDTADSFVVRANSGARLAGYMFYSTSDSLQLPKNYSRPQLTPVAQRSILSTESSWGELTFTSGDYVWLRPYVGDPTDPLNIGAPSEIIQVP